MFSGFRTTFFCLLLSRLLVSGRPFPSTCCSRVCRFQDDPFLLPVALAFAGFRTTFPSNCCSRVCWFQDDLFLLTVAPPVVLVSGRPFPSTCCSTCCSGVCRYLDDLLLLPVALPVALAFAGFRTTFSFFLLLYLLLWRLPVSERPSPSTRCSACVSSARQCLKCHFKGYRLPTSCRSIQRTRSSSAKRARYSLVPLDLVLHLSYARFHYLSPD